jgi:hypothetical protein
MEKSLLQVESTCRWLGRRVRCGADDYTRRDEDGDDPEVKKLRAGLSSELFVLHIMH